MAVLGPGECAVGKENSSTCKACVQTCEMKYPPTTTTTPTATTTTPTTTTQPLQRALQPENL